MSGILISYGEWFGTGLKESADDAKDVASRLSDYSDALNDEIYKKLSQYPGDHTGNITSALNSIKTKMDHLDTDSGNYKTYEADIDDLRDMCQQVDKDVAVKVESLTAEFKSRNNIQTNTVLEGISNLLTEIANKTALGRGLSDMFDWMREKGRSFLQRIEDWYDFQGGEGFVAGILEAAKDYLIAALAIAGGVLAIVGGATGLVFVGAVAGIVGGLIALVNVVANVNNERRALAAYKDDPARARRLSDENSFQDMMRTETKSHIAAWDFGAGAIDAVKITCDVIGIVCGGVEVAQGLKTWAGSDGIFKSLWKTTKHAGSELKTSFTRHNFDFAKNILKNMKTNFKDKMWNFESSEDAVSSMENLIEFTYEGIGDLASLFDGDLSFKDIGKKIFDKAFEYRSVAQFQKDGKGETITIGDFKDIASDSIDGIKDVISKFSSKPGKINVSVPNVAIPDINIRTDMPKLNLQQINLNISIA